MAYKKEKERALSMRHRGVSIGEIANKLGVSKSIVSLWCRNIVLNKIQIQKLIIKKAAYSRHLREQSLRSIGEAAPWLLCWKWSRPPTMLFIVLPRSRAAR